MLFYDIERICQLADVTKRTAHNWRNGGMPRAVRILLELEQGLSPDWPGISIAQGSITLHDGTKISIDDLNNISAHRQLLSMYQAELQKLTTIVQAYDSMLTTPKDTQIINVVKTITKATA